MSTVPDEFTYVGIDLKEWHPRYRAERSENPCRLSIAVPEQLLVGTSISVDAFTAAQVNIMGERPGCTVEIDRPTERRISLFHEVLSVRNALGLEAAFSLLSASQGLPPIEAMGLMVNIFVLIVDQERAAFGLPSLLFANVPAIQSGTSPVPSKIDKKYTFLYPPPFSIHSLLQVWQAFLIPSSRFLFTMSGNDYDLAISEKSFDTIPPRALTIPTEISSNIAKRDRRKVPVLVERHLAPMVLAQADYLSELKSQYGSVSLVFGETVDTVSPILRRLGENWHLNFGGKEAVVFRSIGMQRIAHLVANPRLPVHVTTLKECTPQSVPRASKFQRLEAEVLIKNGEMSESDGRGTGPLLDDQAKAEYRSRINELASEIDEAVESGNSALAEQLRCERDFYNREISLAVGLWGKDRDINSQTELARTAVAKSIKRTINQIRKVHPTFAEHLVRTIETGTYCIYEPDL